MAKENSAKKAKNIAELVSGSEWAFVQLMNQKAQEMGVNATFYDCFGVAHNQVTPIAMASIIKNFVTKYPDILVRSSKRSVYFHGKTYVPTDIKIVIQKDGENITLDSSYNVNGYMCLLLDDLLNIYSVNRNQTERKAELTIG